MRLAPVPCVIALLAAGCQSAPTATHGNALATAPSATGPISYSSGVGAS